MKLVVPALAVLFVTTALGADRHKLDIDPESEDGILLQRIQQEPFRNASWPSLRSMWISIRRPRR
jgi:hypothetical protein